MRLNNLKTNLRFPCLGLNPIIDSISLLQSLSFENRTQLKLDEPSTFVSLERFLLRKDLTFLEYSKNR